MLKGKYLSQDEITNIKRLLAGTELTLQQIGMRTASAKSTIVAINRKFAIRFYNGRRSEWIVNMDTQGVPRQQNLETAIRASTPASCRNVPTNKPQLVFGK